MPVVVDAATWCRFHRGRCPVSRCSRLRAIISGISGVLFFFFTGASRRYRAIYETLIVWQSRAGEREEWGQRVFALAYGAPMYHCSCLIPHRVGELSTYGLARARSCIRTHERVSA